MFLFFKQTCISKCDSSVRCAMISHTITCFRLQSGSLSPLPASARRAELLGRDEVGRGQACVRGGRPTVTGVALSISFCFP